MVVVVVYRLMHAVNMCLLTETVMFTNTYKDTIMNEVVSV